MPPFPSYSRNRELFADFYHLQRRFADCLAHCPRLVRGWLEALPPRDPEPAGPAAAEKCWRTARLSSARRRELRALLQRAEEPGLETGPLAGWLLAAVPVRTYFEIAAAGRDLDLAAGECHRQLAEIREILFLANYGLAKVAARRRNQHDYADMLSAASCGLLDAIDRYVPGEKAARFAHFAGLLDPLSSVPPVPEKRLGGLLSGQSASDRPADPPLPPRPAGGRPARALGGELRAELGLGPAACYWQSRRPSIVSLHDPAGPGGAAPLMEQCLCDPEPEPATLLEEREIAERLRAVLRARVAPAERVMLAYSAQVGSLGDAAEDYLAALESEGAEGIRRTDRAD